MKHGKRTLLFLSQEGKPIRYIDDTIGRSKTVAQSFFRRPEVGFVPNGGVNGSYLLYQH